MGENKRYKKSETYKGVYQSKDGTWFYRYKRVFEKGGKPKYYQQGGFLTDKIAYEARMTDISLCQAVTNSERQEHTMKTFGEFFADFLKNGTDSEASILKYKRLYNAHLKIWEDRNIHTISDADIENLLLSLSICGERDITKTDMGTRENKFQGYSESYQGSFRRCLKFFYKYIHKKYGVVFGNMAQNIDTKPQKLKVLSLFSGIGAPERALKNIGIDFELVNYCELDDNASYAYHLLHGVPLEKDLTDVELLDYDYCEQALPNFDIMVFGKVSQDFSRNGEQKGLFVDPDAQLPSTLEVYHDELPELTCSGLIYRAIQVAIWKRPKFVLIAKIEHLLSEEFKKEFDAILKHLQDAGYNIYFNELNKKDNKVSQSPPCAFMLAVRDDLSIGFEFPVSADLAPFVKSEKDIEGLASEELMLFQGFEPKDAQILWENGYSREDIGKLVGNSITVQVLEAIFRQFVFSLRKALETDIVPNKIIKAKIEKKYTEPLIAYMGNKYRLLPYLEYLTPPNMEFLNFYDLFAGSATIAINTKADKVVINEFNPFLYHIYRGLSKTPRKKAWKMITDISDKYGLPSDCKSCPHYGKKYPKGTPSEEKACYPCKQKYWACRKNYNKIPYEERVSKYWYWGLALVYHSYNASHISHNKKQEFNSPFGNGKCNMSRAEERFFPFAKLLYQGRNNGTVELHCKSYADFMNPKIYADDTPHFFYLDPPYYASTATYNKGWTKEDEKALYEFLDKCNEKQIYWMLSNVIKNNGRTNDILKKWLKDNQGKYYVYFMQRDYSHSSWNRKDEGETLEVVVTNYNASPNDPYAEPIPITMNMYYNPPTVPED